MISANMYLGNPKHKQYVKEGYIHRDFNALNIEFSFFYTGYHT